MSEYVKTQHGRLNGVVLISCFRGVIAWHCLWRSERCELCESVCGPLTSFITLWLTCEVEQWQRWLSGSGRWTERNQIALLSLYPMDEWNNKRKTRVWNTAEVHVLTKAYYFQSLQFLSVCCFMDDCRFGLHCANNIWLLDALDYLHPICLATLPWPALIYKAWIFESPIYWKLLQSDWCLLLNSILMNKNVPYKF